MRSALGGYHMGVPGPIRSPTDDGMRSHRATTANGSSVPSGCMGGSSNRYQQAQSDDVGT